MKRLLLVALALCLALSMVQVAVADDRLKVGGDFRIRAHYYNFDDDDGTDSDDNVEKYFQTRFRLGLDFTLAEGITTHFRADFHDDAVWGNTDWAIGRESGPAYGSQGRPTKDTGFDMEIDRAYVRIERDMFIMQGGQIFQGFGYFTAYTPQATGLALRLKLPVTIDLNYFKIDEGLSLEDEADDQKDTDQFGLQVSYKSDVFTVGGYYSLSTDGAKVDYEDQSVIGLWGSGKVGPVALKAAVDMFGGKQSSDVDYMGTQAWLNGEFTLTQALKLGANVYYALAAADDGSEVQLVRVGENNNVPFDGGYQMAMVPGRYSDCVNVLNNGFPTPYSIAPDSPGGAGVTAFDVYGIFGLMENLSLRAQIGYFSPQDKDVTEWESSMVYQGSVLWTFAPKCDLFGGAYARTDDLEEDDPDTEIGALAVLKVHW
jgi:hypothetical protein